MIEKFQGFSPEIGENVYIASTASVIGDVSIGKCSSVWHSAVVRGDCWKIRIGSYSNIQDGVVCHVTTGGPDLVVGDYVTVGHNAVIHSCSIGNGSLIGMGAVVLDGVEIGEGSIVAANSILLENTIIPPGSLVAGVPGSVRRELSEEMVDRLREQAIEYHSLAMSYLGRGEFSRKVK
ncbi:MAG: gamma carbonic anhydrase family protein [Candidatus Krumholzibacteria bacterium]|nr:gamma carbonic anhydrase family protein [Candidatus Krumholzibacteria bacterium]